MLTPNARPARFAGAALMLALPWSFDAAAQERFQDECPADSIDAGAVVINSPVDCFASVANGVRLINTEIVGESVIGDRSVVLGGSVFESTLSADVSLIGATVSSSRIGSGSVLESGSQVSLSELGERTRVERGASLRGGRGIDIVRMGDDVTIKAGAAVSFRFLGDGSVIGRGAQVFDNTNAGDNFRMGALSTWVGGSVRNNVSIGRRSNIDGGFRAEDGVTIGNSVELGVLVTIGAGTTLRNRITVATDVAIGAGGLIGNQAVLGEGVMVGDNVLIGNNVEVAPNVLIGSGSIIDSGAHIAADVPQDSRVRRDGSVSPVSSEI